MILPNGYELQTTFWEDFTIADAFGKAAIKDTFKRAFDEWKTDIRYVTELAIVTNLKCWDWYRKGNEEISKIYSDMYYKVRNYVYIGKHFTNEERDYYFDLTD